MFEKFMSWIGELFIEFLYGTLFKVLHIYNLSKPTRIILGTLVISIYIAIEIFLIYMAYIYWNLENYYLMLLCIVGAIVFLLLIIAGYLYQRKKYFHDEDDLQ